MSKLTSPPYITGDLLQYDNQILGIVINENTIQWFNGNGYGRKPLLRTKYSEWGPWKNGGIWSYIKKIG